MKLIRHKISATVTIEKVMAGNLAVLNDFKNSPKRIVTPCRSVKDRVEIICKIKESKPGGSDLLSSQ